MNYIKIDRNNPLPLHQQIFSCIKNAIENKQLMPNDKIPTEEELCHLFKISRPVVQQAYNKLIEEELIFRHKGKGSFVLTQKTKYSILENLNSLTEQITMNNMNPTIKEYLREIIDCPNAYLEKLGLEEPTQVLHLKRLYYGDNSPQFYVEIFLPTTIYPKAFEDIEHDKPLSDCLINIDGYKTISSKKHMTAITFDAEICEIFNLKNGSPGFKIEITSFMNNMQITDFTIAYLKGLGSRMTINYF